MCMCVCPYIFICIPELVWSGKLPMVARKGIKYPLARITDACEQPDVGVRNKIWPFGKVKSSLNCWDTSPAFLPIPFVRQGFLNFRRSWNSLCNWGWSWTPDPTDSTPQVLGLHSYTNTPIFSLRYCAPLTLKFLIELCVLTSHSSSPHSFSSLSIIQTVQMMLWGQESLTQKLLLMRSLANHSGNLNQISAPSPFHWICQKFQFFHLYHTDCLSSAWPASLVMI